MAQTRITSGEYRGRLVDTPRGTRVRPTTALVRKALFDILGARVVGARVVDLYAGAGTVGFEALSRGAAAVVAVERDPELASLITATARRLGCAERVRVVVAEVLRWLGSRPREALAADLCFVDAPYGDDEVHEVLEALGAARVALVVCEHHRGRRLPQRIGGLRQVREAAYGATRLTFLVRDPAAAAAEGDVQR